MRDTRVTASLLLNLVANGMSTTDIVTAYPYLEPKNIQQVLRYAAWRAENLYK